MPSVKSVFYIIIFNVKDVMYFYTFNNKRNLGTEENSLRRNDEDDEESKRLQAAEMIKMLVTANVSIV